MKKKQNLGSQTFLKNKKHKTKKLKSFTLTELLVVLVIIGILILVALPNLMPTVTKAKTTEAKLQLQHIYTLQKTYFLEHSKYCSDVTQLGFIQEKLTTEGGSANYLIQINNSTSNSFQVTAKSVVDFDGDGVFNVWSINQDKNLVEEIAD